ncbi:MAG: glycosyltransferase family A protein [Candidatus Pedobacter colombiensis]|uniref:Glycosyltransferase family A protein n=1 Tax=Candidatus Pedobacter colombiensis TaxID=3121371 RepID=A0AAJ6B7A9_9SPHI|nr:glycosyltransferase family A protein [Pedobacter sp.]WEK19699.1 MAG: glycosyltransferase family A protein [Pedobacter sp.]
MPVYNAASYIKDSIQSLLVQTYTKWELIVVNDGSTDGTDLILSAFIDERIKVFHQKNKGQSAAANQAFNLSQGDYIKFFDADDLLSPKFLASQVNRITKNPDCIVSAQWGRFYDDNINTFKLNPEPVWMDMPPDEWLVTAWMNAQPMMQCALWLIPRNTLRLSGLWDEKLSLINDFEFFTRVLLNSKKVLFEPEATLYYRSGLTGSISGAKTRAAYESAFYAIKGACDRLLNYRNDTKAQLACSNIWQNFIYEIYPKHTDLITSAKTNIGQLIKPTLSYPCGGCTKIAKQLIGWKATKRLKNKIENSHHR